MENNDHALPCQLVAAEACASLNAALALEAVGSLYINPRRRTSALRLVAMARTVQSGDIGDLPAALLAQGRAPVFDDAVH